MCGPSRSVGVRVAVDAAMTVIYRWRADSPEDWQPTQQTVKFANTACGFGGMRQWFLCPYCFRRVAVLVVAWAQVACRHCLHLTYASCNEDEISRSWRKREKITTRLGAMTTPSICSTDVTTFCNGGDAPNFDVLNISTFFSAPALQSLSAQPDLCHSRLAPQHKTCLPRQSA